MKKLLLLTIMISYGVFAQCVDPIIANGECTPVFTFPSTVAWVANPNSAGINTSANVGKYTDNAAEAWDALTLDYGAAIDLSTNNFLHMDVYTPTKSIQVLAKLEGGSSTAEEKYSPFSNSTTDWVHFVWDFSDISSENHKKIALIFDAAESIGNDPNPVDYYFDNLRWASSVTLSIKRGAIDEFSVNPNPVSDILNINATSEINEITVMDISGKTLLNTTVVNSKTHQLNVSFLKTGVHIVSIQSENDSKSIKIVKK